MRLRPLLIALVVWTGFRCALLAGEPSPAPTAPSAASEPLRTIYVGVMGEVAHPGVYAAPADSMISALLKKAGGITPQANKSLRVFRGGLLAEQVFIGSGELPPLLANDLIVVGTSGVSKPKSTGTELVAAEKSPRSNGLTTNAAVQIAFLNLLDHPVIVKMSTDQATLPHIVELLGQPAECAAKIRIFAPLGAGPRESESADSTKRALDSGTVLVFATASCSRETLPALPEPIVEATPLPAPKPMVRAETVVTSGSTSAPVLELPKEPSQPVAEKSASPSVDLTPREASAAPPSSGPVMTAQLPISLDGNEHPVVDGDHSEKADIAPHLEPQRIPRPLFRPRGMTFGTTNTPLIRAERDPRTARMVLLMTAMSALAGIAMLLTIASIAQRWMSSTKARWLRQMSESSCVAQSGGVPAPPPPADLSGVGRPIRIDAGRPMTRLSVDLAAVERKPPTASAA